MRWNKPESFRRGPAWLAGQQSTESGDEAPHSKSCRANSHGYLPDCQLVMSSSVPSLPSNPMEERS